MNRPLSIFSCGSLAKAGAAFAGVTLAGVLGPVGSTSAQVPAPAPPPEVVVETEPQAARVEVAVAEETVPEGQPAEISDWALAGVVWSDAHLVRKLAQAAAENSDDSAHREKMALLVNDCNELINSLETFGWRRIAVERAEQKVAAAAAAAAAAEPVADADVVVTEETRRVPLDPDAAAAALDVAEGALTGEVTAEDRPFTFRRYRVADYLDETSLEPRTTAAAVERGTEEAIAAAPDKADAAFDAVEGTGPDSRRQAQTQSATLPYAGDSIYDTEDLHPNATYPNRPDAVAAGLRSDPPRVTSLRPATEAVETVVPSNVPTEKLLDEVDARPVVRSVATLDITRYTDRVDQFRQDAHWVKFRLAANQQRWRMLQNRGDDESVPALAEHLDAALLQLQADAATALAASKDSQLAEVLREIVQ